MSALLSPQATSGLRRMGDFVGAAASIGAWNMVSRNLIDRTDEEGNRYGGLYPLLEPVVGANSQDPENADTRFSAFTDGRSQIGTQYGGALNLLRQKAPGEAPGPLSRPVDALRPADKRQPKLQNELTKQVEEHRVRDITGRFNQLHPGARRRTAFQNRVASTAAFLTTIPTHATEVPRQLFPSLAALLLGAHDPHLENLIGSRIGDTNLRVDVHGDALGVAIFPGDR